MAPPFCLNTESLAYTIPDGEEKRLDEPDLSEVGFCTVPDLIHAAAERRPAHPALTQESVVLDYAGLDALMNRVAAALQRDGVQHGEAVAICASTSIEYAAVFLGCLRAGVAVAPLAPSSTAESLAVMMADAGARVLFLDQTVAAQLEPARGRIACPRIALDASDAGTPLQQWLAPEGTVPAPAPIEPRWPFNIIYSSGTTGIPKGIVQSHGMRWTQIRRASLGGYGPDAITLLATPLYSNTTLVSFLPTLALGGSVVLMPKFNAAGYLALAERHRVTHTMLVPVQYQRIMALPDFDDYDLSSFRFKFCTSAPFAAALKGDVLKRWPGGLIEYYGMTEGGGTCILAAHEFPDKLHTVGQAAPEHDIRIIDERGQELPPGSVGEIVGHSEAMMSGYHNQPGKTADAEWRDETGKRFIRTGDVGRFDEQGFLTLLDRKKDMIISGGFNIYPSDLEAVMIQHPAVSEVAVVGVNSQRWGETPVAFVVLKSAVSASAGELLAWANGRLGKTQRLTAVELATVLPRSAIGKVLKRELRDDYNRRPQTQP
jgi:acyl-CoA synthetase (AMP-forming)/AMP-acid ligase II